MRSRVWLLACLLTLLATATALGGCGTNAAG
jgi:hypothetical protein